MKKATLLFGFFCFFVVQSYAQVCITITEPPAVEAGMPTASTVCQAPSGASAITLNNNLASEDAGGVWTLAPSSPDPMAAFNAGTGTFDPNGVTMGVYVFRYTVGTLGCNDVADVSVTIQNCCPPTLCSPVSVVKH
ncbi:MAG: hypothetical protein RLZZ292_1262 [Bacteroidota bacterium]|jgi:hypothetical protein